MFKKMCALLLLPCMLLGCLSACMPPETPGGTTPGGDDPGTPGGDDPTVEPTYAQTYPYTDDDGVLHIRYQDTYDFGREIRDITDVVITSKVTGTTQKDANLLVKQKDSQSVYADGCGSATVQFKGNQSVKVQVDPSPINMLFVTGQSNASGDMAGNLKPGYSTQYAQDYIRSPETMAYFTWTGQRVSVDVAKDKEDYTWAYENGGTLWHPETPSQVNFIHYSQYIPTTLDWETASNAVGPQPQQFSIPKGQTTFTNCGWNAALAYEWIQQTGERVWIVNCSQGGMEIQHFQPSESGTGTNEYYQAVAVFNAALETLYKEVDAGHFVLNHMAYYWFHGESNTDENTIGGVYNAAGNRFMRSKGNRYLTAEEYAEYFKKMHLGFMQDVVYDHEGVKKELEFCGIMTIRANNDGKENTYDHLKLVGARNAEYYAGATTDEALSNVFVVSNVTERWVGEYFDTGLDTNPEADIAVAEYFLETYGSEAKFKAIFGYDMPTTVYQLRPGCHYLMHGHNEMGMDCARNSLRILNLLSTKNLYDLSYDIEDEATITLFGIDGMTALTDTIVFDKATKKATVCPQITPLYRQVDGIRIEVVSEGFTFDSNVFTASSKDLSTLQFKLYLADELYQEYTFNVVFK